VNQNICPLLRTIELFASGPGVDFSRLPLNPLNGMANKNGQSARLFGSGPILGGCEGPDQNLKKEGGILFECRQSF
jgi:hypothetical protein